VRDANTGQERESGRDAGYLGASMACAVTGGVAAYAGKFPGRTDHLAMVPRSRYQDRAVTPDAVDLTREDASITRNFGATRKFRCRIRTPDFHKAPIFRVISNVESNICVNLANLARPGAAPRRCRPRQVSSIGCYPPQKHRGKRRRYFASLPSAVSRSTSKPATASSAAPTRPRSNPGPIGCWSAARLRKSSAVRRAGGTSRGRGRRPACRGPRRRCGPGWRRRTWRQR
jgi:hypothetical protein